MSLTREELDDALGFLDRDFAVKIRVVDAVLAALRSQPAQERSDPLGAELARQGRSDLRPVADALLTAMRAGRPGLNAPVDEDRTPRCLACSHWKHQPSRCVGQVGPDEHANYYRCGCRYGVEPKATTEPSPVSAPPAPRGETPDTPASIRELAAIVGIGALGQQSDSNRATLKAAHDALRRYADLLESPLRLADEARAIVFREPAPAPAETTPPAAPLQHTLKVWPQFFAALDSGAKGFEVRKDDRNFQVGDILRLREWSEASGYSGRETTRTVSYVLRDWAGLSPDYVVMSLNPPLPPPSPVSPEADIIAAQEARWDAPPSPVEPPKDEPDVAFALDLMDKIDAGLERLGIAPLDAQADVEREAIRAHLSARVAELKDKLAQTPSDWDRLTDRAALGMFLSVLASELSRLTSVREGEGQ